MKSAVRRLFALVIIFGVLFFFYGSFRRHWTDIRTQVRDLDYLFLALSCIPIFASSLLATYGWQVAVNALSHARPVTFPQSVATVNTSNLMKYIPGKVWSYAMQMYWMANAGFSKSLVAYVNVLNLAVSILTTFIVGFGLLLAAPKIVPVALTASALLALLLFDAIFIRFHASVTNRMISLFNRMFGRDIATFHVPRRLLIDLHLIHTLAAICLCLAAYLTCYGIGFSLGPSSMLPVMSSLLIADVIGFLAIIVPGGLGVREGVMYVMLRALSSGPLSLLLPVASRIVNMLVEAALGGIALVLLRRFVAAGREKAVPAK